MFSTIFGWIKGLSIAGKLALGIVSVGAVGAMASPGGTPPPVQEPPLDNGGTQKVLGVTKTVTETATVPYSKETVETNDLGRGVQEVTTTGVDGVKTITYKVTFIEGAEVSRVKVGEEITKQAIAEVTSVGTYIAPEPPAQLTNCDSNYAGACVPIASDVDCGGGSGNGPAYVYGTVEVIGYDVYGLDRDGDGYGCE